MFVSVRALRIILGTSKHLIRGSHKLCSKAISLLSSNSLSLQRSRILSLLWGVFVLGTVHSTGTVGGSGRSRLPLPLRTNPWIWQWLVSKAHFCLSVVLRGACNELNREFRHNKAVTMLSGHLSNPKMCLKNMGVLNVDGPGGHHA